MRIAVALLFVAAMAPAQTFPLDTLSGLELLNVKADVVKYRGRTAVRLVENGGGEAIAILSATDFRDGIIEVDLAGAPRAGASETARGFAGIAFRVQPKGEKLEAFYLRPTNGRADDQLRRNHATQYISHPDFPWQKLRKETPGVYESYVDLVAGEWTHVKIEVKGTTARLYVHGAKQPCLIVNDLKLGETKGAIALWIGAETEAWFSRLEVK